MSYILVILSICLFLSLFPFKVFVRPSLPLFSVFISLYLTAYLNFCNFLWISLLSALLYIPFVFLVSLQYKTFYSMFVSQIGIALRFIFLPAVRPAAKAYIPSVICPYIHSEVLLFEDESAPKDNCIAKYLSPSSLLSNSSFFLSLIFPLPHPISLFIILLVVHSYRILLPSLSLSLSHTHTHTHTHSLFLLHSSLISPMNHSDPSSF
ncbi:unnamed protein product [Acanthosepion pharaonis]|uniref:Uncharacterized protein n=1 Tax=Acanthosepion pharaonis TaxID=158019 RepID=A0A812AND2_ACAPH|nr:unnamed protein product [Sepia pharaonis]